jgi:transposase-like protein
MTSLVEIYRRFPDRAAATAHLEKVRWPHGPECPLCGSTSTARHAEKGQFDRLQCWGCKKSFSATVGTIFHNSHIDLQRWFLLISLMLNAKKGLSAMQAARDLEMRRPTVWSMMHRIRAAMVDDGKLLSGLVEMDEAYVGGKPRRANRKDDHINKPRGPGGTAKAPVVGAVERGGRVKVRLADKSEFTQNEILDVIAEFIDQRGTMLTTDENAIYNSANDFVAHRRINHSVSYSERDLFVEQFGTIHTNTIEGFWSIVKRAIYGQFHHVSRKYLPLYLRELTYRYNGRHDDVGLDGVLHLAVKP